MLLIWTLSLLLGTVTGKEVCFPRLGCFSDDSPWAGTLERPLKLLPWAPEDVNTHFLLYTNENPNNFQELTADGPTIKGSNFRRDRKTRFIIHGYTEKGDDDWLANMCRNFFVMENVNCICVDWKGGSRTGYTQASQNIRIVGAEVAYFVEVLKAAFGYSPSDVHIIGHSLGAHAAAEAGRRLNGTIERITGLDPAGPSFEGTPELVRLDPSDAMFVDVIHTDAASPIPNMGLGIRQTVGHLDFFPNGGREMPGCHKNSFSQMAVLDGTWQDFSAIGPLISFFPRWWWLVCVFIRREPLQIHGGSSSEQYPIALLAFADEVWGWYILLTWNKCFSCTNGGCPQMGHYADRFPGKTNGVGQKFYLNTGDTSNFARWRYKVSVTLSGEEATGMVQVSLSGNKGNSKQYEIFKGFLQPGDTHSNEFDSDVNVGEVEKVEFIWDNDISNLILPKVGAPQITVERNDGEVFNFCSAETVRENVLLILTSCWEPADL
ncbi:pancreatic triacylglycerol lipase-like isoform X1 [Tamandua tetradactyla]|uniref:pancreatic triacylglycerol lipase-like isoform X1 n=1 Tax=Tamandua tetradactyla TaxID=48850 RepID=UPI0040538C99